LRALHGQSRPQGSILCPNAFLRWIRQKLKLYEPVCQA
jgi:hypothetical protein